MAAWAVAAGVVFFAAVVAHIRFPFHYHHDEGKKAAQVLTGERNLRHPPLLVNAAAAVHAASGGEPTRQAATQSGRLCSAAFAAAAVALFTWLAFLLAGPAAAVFAGLLVAFHPFLFELAHYFKEDTALLAGWAAVLATAEAYRRRPSRARAALAGAAAAFALSGKYIGVIPAAAGVWLTARSMGRSHGARGERSLHLLLFALAAIVLLAAANYQALGAPHRVAACIRMEVEKQFQDDTGYTPWGLLARQNGVAVFVLCAAGLLFAPIFRRPIRPVAWAAVLLPVLYLLVTVPVRRSVPRYQLPVCVSLAWLAGLGTAALVFAEPLRRRRWTAVAAPAAGALLFAWALAHLAFQTAGQARAFASKGTRVELEDYVDRHLPAEAVVASDLRVFLPTARSSRRPPLRQRVVDIPIWNSPPTPSIADWLREQGVTHVAVAARYAGYYRTRDDALLAGQFSDLAERRAFYEYLDREGKVVWERPGMINELVAPGLRLYALPTAAGTSLPDETR